MRRRRENNKNEEEEGNMEFYDLKTYIIANSE